MITKIRAQKVFQYFLIHFFLIGLAAFALLPFLWMVYGSIQPLAMYSSTPGFTWPQAIADWYSGIFQYFDVARVMTNSILIAATFSLGSALLCALGGFGFVRAKFPGRNFLFTFLLATMMIPAAVTMMPEYFVIVKLHWIDTYLPLIVPGLANAFGIIYMRQYISTISTEILDAARIDGASEGRIFTTIILPLSAPAIANIGLISFMLQWNDPVKPLIYLFSRGKFTIAMLLASFVSQNGQPQGEAYMTIAVFSVVPLLIIYLLFQRRFMEGIMSGAVKG
jgi:ABC-type glycerol-3-phosphate transport system permease component